MIKLTYYQILQAIRMPLTFFWTIGLPTILYMIFSYTKENALLFLGYIVFSSYLYGGTLQVIGQRESGFLKTFIQSKRSLFNHLISIYFSNLIIILVSISIYLAIVLKNDFIFLSIGYLSSVLLISPIVFLVCQALMILKIRSIDISTLCNMMLMLFTMLSFSNFNIFGIYINIINPIYNTNSFIVNMLNDGEIITSIFPLMIFSLIGLVATIKLNIQSYEGR
ncbi:hypothetical protein [Photorhabdus stackebrandtii]|uniref:Uncharacterized protein n=1 Tax=Photorhabdus stackebrandtii TaxID=1123042 RepID=A0A7X5TNC2_9GAMM|nr:hypothetical protein [Photorhabdus stackebrandtii]NHB98554.1 hypothetical protein [Photorhabdus stackebrandtii]